MNAERRRTRSANPLEALELLLEHVAERTGMRALFLATEEGLLFAGKAMGLDLERLAVIAGAGVREGLVLAEARGQFRPGERFSSHAIEAGGMKLHLAAVGCGEFDGRYLQADLDRILR